MDGDERILRALRNQAWERAKGELRAMLHTFYSVNGGQSDNARPGQFLELDKAIEDFTELVEENGLAE